MNGAYHFSCSLSDEQALSLRRRIPGIRTYGGIDAPANCAWLVPAALKAEGISFKVTAPRETAAPTFRFPAETRDWVPAFLAAHQREAIEEAATCSRALWHPPGSGKSLAAIIWALFAPGRILWVTRAISRIGHQREIERYTTATVQRIEGQKPVALDLNARFWVISWELLPYHYEALIKAGFHSIVFDEIHKAKNGKRFDVIIGIYGETSFKGADNIAFAAMQLSRHAKRRLGTTATPIKDRVRDLWAQMDLLFPGEYGTRQDFENRYCDTKVNDYGGRDTRGSSNLDELRQRVSFNVHQVDQRTTHGNLPPLRRQITTVPFAQQLTVKERKQSKADAGRGAFEAKLALAAARKRAVVIELTLEANSSDQKVVIFTGRRNDAATLAKMLAKHCNGPVLCVTGEDSATARNDALQVYINAPVATLVATADCMGEAVDGLQCTNLAIMAMLPYTLGQVEQWEGRFWRLGQLVSVIIHYVVAAGTVDEHVAQILLSKLPPVETVSNKTNFDGFRNTLLGGKSDRELAASLIATLLEVA